MGKGLKKILEDMAEELPGLVASGVVLIEDGLSIEEISTDPDVDPGAASAYLATIVKSSAKVIKVLGGDQVAEHIVISTDQNYFLIRHVSGKSFFHFVMTKKDEYLGRTGLVMRRCSKRILDAIEETKGTNKE